MIKCKWCDKYFKNNQSLAGHCRLNHKDEWSKRNNIVNMNENGKLSCPLCDFEGLSLNKHLTYKHNMKNNEILMYKENGYKMQIDNRKRKNYKCDFCDDIFLLRNVLHKHIKDNHPNNYTKSVVKENNKGIECKICNTIKINIFQHIKESHQDFTWEDYCLNYKHDVTLKSYFSDEHKINLSKNKILFYNETERGLELRKEQSMNLMGNTFSTDKQFLSKMSSSKSNDMLNGNLFSEHSYGIYISFIYNDDIYYVRSFEEYKIIITLLINNKKFKYEQQIKYDYGGVQKLYILDLEYDNNYIEIKSNLNNLDDKYIYINKELYKINKELYILTYETFCEKFNFVKYSDMYIINIFKNMYISNQIINIVQKVQKNKKSRFFKNIDERDINITESNGGIIYKYKNKKIK